MGVQVQARKMPGLPMARILLKRISAPSSTRPVLMKYSVQTAGFTQLGVPMVLLMSRPKTMAHSGNPKPQYFISACVSAM